MSIFGNIQGASISQSGPKLPDNFSGIVEINSTTIFKGHTGTRYLVEMVVHETNLPAEAPAGYRPSWSPDMSHANTAGNILCYLGSCYGFDPKMHEQQMRQQITPQVAEYSVSTTQPLRGKFIHVETKEVQTKQNRDFLTHRFSPTAKTFQSRLNDPGVSPTAMAAPAGFAPSAPGGFAPSAPGGFSMPTAPGGFAPPQQPQMPQAPMAPQGYGAPPQGFGAPPGGLGIPTAPMQGAPPSFPQPTIPQMPSMGPPQGFGMPAAPQAPQGFAPQAPQGFAPQAPQGFAPQAPQGFGMPPAPMSAPMPPAPVAFPPQGWKAHPAAAGWFYLESNPQMQKTEADLRAGR